MKLRQNSVNQIYTLNAFFFFLLTGATWYYHTIYLVFTYFALFTYYEDDIFLLIFNLHVHGSKFGRKSFFKVELYGVHGVCFFQVCLTVEQMEVEQSRSQGQERCGVSFTEILFKCLFMHPLLVSYVYKYTKWIKAELQNNRILVIPLKLSYNGPGRTSHLFL